MKITFPAVIVLAGVCAVGYGAWQIYPPTAYIAVGLALIWLGIA